MPVTLSATRTTSLFNDQDSDGRVDLGDTLFIRLQVSNTGDQDALNSVINDALTGQTLVAGSINISPLAVNDVFNAVGNTQLLVGGATGFNGPTATFAGNLLSNDTNLAGDNFPGFTLTSVGAFATSGAGTVTINANGSFAYNPAVGFTGADTFTYTLRDAGQDGIAGNSDDLTSTATVTINVANTVWYVDQNYDGSNGASNGSSARPFTSLANVNGAGGAGDVDGANHIIYVRGAHTANMVLETGQSLIGNGVALTVGGYTLATAGAANTLTHGTGTGVLLATNNTLSGFNLVGTDFTGVAIADNNGTVGNLAISSVSVSGRGQIIDVDQGGALNVTFGSAASTSSSGTGGVIDLAGVTGTFTVSGATTIDTSTGTHNQNGIDIGGAGTNLTANFSGGTTLSMGTNINGGGVNLSTNSGTTTFAGLTINTSANNATGFQAISAGTVNVTGATNTVTSGSATAVNVQNTTIGGSGMTWQSVTSSGGGTANAINLVNAGSGGFTITGTGTTANSGGIIGGRTGTDGATTSGIGIYIENTNNISLSNMSLNGDFGNFGIRGVNVNNFTLRDSTANSASADNGGFGTSNAADEGVISFDNLTGTALFTGNNLSDGHEDIIVIENTSGTLNLTVNDSAANQAVIGRNGEAVGSATGNDGILVTTSGNASLTMNVTGVVFEGWRGDAIQVDARGTSTANVTIANNTFHNGHLDIVSGGGGLSLGISAGTGAGPSMVYALTNNSFRGAEGNVINVSGIGPSGSMSGTITGNTIGTNDGVHQSNQANTGSNAGGSGIFVRIEKDDTGGTLTSAVRIENNQIGDIVNGIAGIHLLANGGAGGTGTARLEATIRNNSIDELGLNVAGGIYADIGGAGGNDAARMGLNIETNNVNMTGANNAIAALVLGDLTNNAQYYFPGFNGPYTDAGLATFHTSAQPGGEGNTFTVAGFVAQVTTAPTGTFATNANFVLAVPLLAAAPPGSDWEAALREAQRVAYEEWLAENATSATGGGGRLGSLPGALPMPNDSSGPDVVHIDDPDGNGAGVPSGSAGGAGSSPILDDGILTKAELDWLVEAAIQRWIAAGATEEQVAAMRATEIGVSDLGGLYIGTSSPGLIILDDNAAGHNWFLDTTPDADEEYTLQNGELRADPSTIAGNRVDLLTAIMHELGHQIGLEDGYGAEDDGSLMYGFINPGERHLPGEEEVAAGTGEAIELTAYALGAVGFGTIQPGTTRQISWQATYDGPGTNQVVGNVNNNSTVTYNNGSGDIVVNSNVETLGPATALAVDTLSLGNQVFRDVNRNGVFDAGDSGIGGVALTLFADTNNNGVYDAGVDTQLATTTTLSGFGAGTYQFANLAPGNYIVRVDAANFTGGGALNGLVSSPSGGDPDNNTNNDSNGGAITAGIVTNPTITLAFNTETANDGTGQLDINDTLDFGFLAPNVAPTSGSLSGDTATWTEGGAAVALDVGGNATLSDTDSANFDGGSLTVAITGALAEDGLFVDTSGSVTVAGNALLVGGIQIATFTGGGFGGGAFVFSFDADATPAAVQALARALRYNNNGGDNPTDGNRTITWTLVDGDGTVSGGNDTLSFTSTVNVDPVDDPGTAGADSGSVAENASVVVTVLTNDSDVDGPPPSPAQVNGTPVAIGGSVILPSGARVTRNADGTLTYDTNGAFGPTPAPGSGASNTPANDSFTYTLAGGGTATVTMTITGIDTDDRLVGNAGGGNLAGGVGNDTYVVIDGADIVIEQPNEGNDTVETARAGYTLTANVENLTGTVNTGQGLAGNALSNRITGGTGNDEMQGKAGDDTYVVRNSGDTIIELVGEGTDTVETDLASYVLTSANVENLTGTSASAQTLVGNGLANRITGGLGNDTLVGLLGDDTYVILNAGDTIVEGVGEGNDTVETALASYTLTAANVENLVGTSNAGQTLTANGGNNRISGGTGNDTFAGGLGDDVYVVGNAGDTVVEAGGGGTDTIETALNYYFMAAANVENLTFTGTGDFYGSGNDGANVITGGAANDTLRGGLGADTLVGGLGNDFYLFDTALGGGNVDAITGFVSGSDRILLDNLIFTALAEGGVAPGAFVLGTSAGDANDRLIYDAATGALYYDADGNGAGAAVQFATLTGAPALTASDFIVI